MTRPVADLVKHLWTGTGTGTITLGAAIAGFAAFPSSLNGEPVSISIEHENGTERETVVGIYTHATTSVTRDFVTFSTAGAPTKQNFTAGNKFVRLTALGLDVVENKATVSPGATDDVAAGYIAGRSRWLNTATGELWFCISHAVGAAVWRRSTDAAEVVVINPASPYAWNVAAAPALRITALDHALTINASGASDGQTALLVMVQDATGGRVVTLGTGFAQSAYAFTDLASKGQSLAFVSTGGLLHSPAAASISAPVLVVTGATTIGPVGGGAAATAQDLAEIYYTGGAATVTLNARTLGDGEFSILTFVNGGSGPATLAAGSGVSVALGSTVIPVAATASLLFTKRAGVANQDMHIALGAVPAASTATYADTSGTISPTATAEINIVFLTGTLTTTLTASLPAAASYPSRQFVFFRTGGGQFDFVAGPKTARKGEMIWLISDGSAWQAIENRRPAQVRVTSPSLELTFGAHHGRKVTMTAAADLTLLLRDDYPTDTNFLVTVEPASIARSLTLSPEGGASIQAAVNPLVIPANMPYEVYIYVDANSDGVSAASQVYDRSGLPLVREVSATGSRTLGSADVGSQQRNSSGTATWTINQFIGSIFVDNIDGGAITLAPGAGVTINDTSVAGGKFATLIGRVGGAQVEVIEAP